MVIDKKLIEFAFPRQKELLVAMEEHDSVAAAARSINMGKNDAYKTLKSLKARAAKRGYSPEHDNSKIVPEGYLLKGTSTLYGADMKPKLQWVKTNIDHERQIELMLEAYDQLSKCYSPVEQREFTYINYNTDVTPFYNIGDAHIGMLSSKIETGHNFDISKAIHQLSVALTTAIDSSEVTERCVINDLGDATHYDNIKGVTSEHGNILDNDIKDSRYSKMISAYTDVMRQTIDYALNKHKYVDVIINQGNHSRINDIWMCRYLTDLYRNEPRVNIIENSNVFIPYTFGDNLIMTHHGDKCKEQRLKNVMITDFREMYGKAKHHYIWTGHIHSSNRNKSDNGGITWESFNILAPSDKYAHDGGWRSRQCLTRVDIHKEYGEIGRRVVSIEEVYSKL